MYIEFKAIQTYDNDIKCRAQPYAIHTNLHMLYILLQIENPSLMGAHLHVLKL